MSIAIRNCRADEFPTVIDRLNQEFVFSKQRSLSLQERFPNALSMENLQQVRVAVFENGLCGALAIRLFNWVTVEQIWRGAMIGMVWVTPLMRGKGIGRLLMTSATEFLREKGVDFGILWTGTHAFYERAGWTLNDLGLFGKAVDGDVRTCSDGVSCQDLSCIEPTWLERMRSGYQPQRVERRPLDYRVVPIPADKVLCFSSPKNGASDGYALVGEQDGTGYFYEMVAPCELWEPIWTAIARRFKPLLVNGHLGDPFSQWLVDQGHVVWQPQNKAMWLRVSNLADNAPLSNWHVSYFDWI